jgi:hypothetical protein
LAFHQHNIRRKIRKGRGRVHTTGSEAKHNVAPLWRHRAKGGFRVPPADGVKDARIFAVEICLSQGCDELVVVVRSAVVDEDVSAL